MSYKQKGVPYDKDNMNIAIYRKELTDGSAAKSNHTGIILNKDLSPEMEEAAIAHEKVHQHQQRNGDLDYDKENFYWKGKTYSRKNLNEHNEELPWEKEAYAKSNGILNGNTKDMKESFKLKGYRGNNKSFANLSNKGLIGASMGEGDPDVVTKTKTKKKRFGPDKGSTVTTTKYVNTKTGEKGGSKRTVGPVTQNANIKGSGEANVTLDYDVKPFSPTITPTPSTSKPVTSEDGDTKPYVKPLKKPSYRETYEKTDKSVPFEDWKGKAIKWNKDNPPANTPPRETPPKLEKVPARPAVSITPKLNTDIRLDASTTYNQPVKEESWSKKKGKKKENPPPKVPSLHSTESSVSCTKEGECGPGPGRMHSEGMFGTMSGKQKREINKQQRKINRASREDFRGQMADHRKDKRQDNLRKMKNTFSKSTAYKQKKRKGKDMRPLSVRLGFKS